MYISVDEVPYFDESELIWHEENIEYNFEVSGMVVISMTSLLD